MANYMKTVVSPLVPAELHDTFISSIDSGSIRTMPNKSMPAAPHPTPGALLMGDAFNMCHPLTGGGMTVALPNVVVLRNLLKPCEISMMLLLCLHFVQAIDSGSIRTMPNKSMPAAPHPMPGALLMGDAFNMRHPLTGGGMTVALPDVVVLRNLLKPCEISMMLLLCLHFVQAGGFHNKHIGRCPVQSI